MTDALQDELQRSLGAAYRVERELGGGGMSRVFVARDQSLDRDVVVKVLTPALAAGLSAERFAREIRMAASLQQANIVPVLSAGTMGELPYYTMPYVQGESLRHRLAKGPLGISEVVSILRDVARALAYAHERGIVHRDIKPDNVLLSGGTAVVTDFGIAKAVGVARAAADGATTTGGALTGLGSAIGTPAYMAPEQAAADPDADHRLDLYAFGCLAYELLAGVPPFHGLAPQKLLAAHMATQARPVAELRPDTPPALASLVARCLEKEPDARPSSATGLLGALDEVFTSGGSNALPPLLLGGPAMFRRALLVYVVAFVLVVVLARVAIVQIGLPDWVLPGALVVMGLGLPVLLFTGYAQRVVRHAATMTPTFTPEGSPATNHGTMAQLAIKASPHLSWRRAARWGGYAFAGFALVIVAFMTLRAQGIGRFGTLFAAGRMSEDDVILVDDFASPSDSTLGRTIAQGVKTDLAQSRAVVLLGDAAVTNALQSMQRADQRLTLPVAREVALRAGAKMVVDGSVVPLGSGFLLTLRLVSADSGRDVVSYQESVDSPRALIGAVGNLTRKLRAQIGESLREVQASPRLAEVTTTSLDALRKYSEGLRALRHDNDRPRFIQLMHEAIASDSSFAMAYQTLATELNNRGGRQTEASTLIRRAYDLRARLPQREQRIIESYYYQFGPPEVRDSSKSARALFAAAADPADHGESLNAVAVTYQWTNHPAEAESVFRLAIQHDTSSTYPLGNLIALYLRTGRVRQSDSLTAIYGRRFPRNQNVSFHALELLHRRGATDSAETLLRTALASSTDPFRRANIATNLIEYSLAAGQVRNYDWAITQWINARRDRGVVSAQLDATLDRVRRYAFVLGDRDGAQRLLGSIDVDRAMDSIPPDDRPEFRAATAFAAVGNVTAATRHLRALEKQVPENDIRLAYQLHEVRADIALAEHRWDDVITEARKMHAGSCVDCGNVQLALAYDARGDRDSAIAAFQRVRDNGYMTAWEPPVLRRLGELYEAKGDLRSAIDSYSKFVGRWKNADTELQPQVAEIKKRITALQAREARSR